MKSESSQRKLKKELDGRSFKQYETLKELYEAYGVEYPEDISEDYQERIERFRKKVDG